MYENGPTRRALLSETWADTYLLSPWY